MKPKFLLYIAHKYGFPIARPLQKELLKRGYEVVWFVEIEENKKYILPHEVLLNSVDEVRSYKASVNLVACNEVPPFFPGIKVQVFHGFSIDKRSEARGHFRIRGLFDLYCTQGPSTTEPFLKLKEKHPHFDVIETGWSKVDPLFPVQTSKNTKPVVIFASTFTKGISLAHNNDVFEEVKRLIKSKGWDWIITLHPKMDHEIVNKFKSLKGENVTYIDNLDSLEPLKKADVMLSDTSSVVTEFIIQKKPVVTFNNRKPNTYLINILEVNAIEKSLEKALSYPEEVMVAIDEYIKKIHPYADGKSSARVIDATLHFLQQDTAKKLKSKPFNIIRRFKIRKRLNYFKF